MRNLVVLLVLAIIAVPVIGGALTHYTSNPRWHAHVGHGIKVAVVLGGIALAFFTTPLVRESSHIFGGPAAASTMQPKPLIRHAHKRHATHKPHQRQWRVQ